MSDPQGSTYRSQFRVPTTGATSELALDHPKRVLHLRPDARLAMLLLFCNSPSALLVVVSLANTSWAGWRPELIFHGSWLSRHPKLCRIVIMLQRSALVALSFLTLSTMASL